MAQNPLVKLVIQGVLSLGLAGAGVFMLVATDLKANPELGAIAGSMLGAVTAYWLK